jgi:hypothetical protein
MPRETSRANMAMSANRAADTSKLAEARRAAELGGTAVERSIVGSGNKRLFCEKREAYTKRAVLARGCCRTPNPAAQGHRRQRGIRQRLGSRRKAIEKNKAAEDLRHTLTARLTKASARLGEVTERLIQVHMQIKELELRFREAVKLVRIPARALG